MATFAKDYWQLMFDADGKTSEEERKSLIAKIKASGTSDLFLMSHGWATSEQDAKDLYSAMFPLIEAATPGVPPGSRFLGIFWPSIWFPDPDPADREAVRDAVSSGAPGVADAVLSGKAISDALVQSMPDAASDLRHMGSMIDEGLHAARTGTDDKTQNDAVQEFHSLFQSVFPALIDAGEDSGEDALINSTSPKEDYQALSQAMGSEPGGGDVAGIGDIYQTVWNGAKNALRVGSFYQMKARAGVIGREGLATFLVQLSGECPRLRVHLIGHSFGARLVSYALAGISTPDASPVASLVLLQGAFSHWAFTDKAGTGVGKAGSLHGFADRVHGPLVSTFTEADWAVGIWYPKASFLSGQDVETVMAERWGGLGSDGFRKANPSDDVTLPLDAEVALTPGTYYRVDANAIIRDVQQSAFAGAHSDIRHPEIASLITTAANAPR